MVSLFAQEVLMDWILRAWCGLDLIWVKWIAVTRHHSRGGDCRIRPPQCAKAALAH